MRVWEVKNDIATEHLNPSILIMSENEETKRRLDIDHEETYEIWSITLVVCISISGNTYSLVSDLLLKNSKQQQFYEIFYSLLLSSLHVNK
jgi:hypothetical protein